MTDLVCNDGTTAQIVEIFVICTTDQQLARIQYLLRKALLLTL
jgi:hypothetical protein